MTDDTKLILVGEGCSGSLTLDYPTAGRVRCGRGSIGIWNRQPMWI